MKHKGLDVDGIRKLVAASDSIKDGGRSVFRLLTNTQLALSDAFARHRKLTRQELDKVVSSCRTALADSPFIQSRHTLSKATISRPNSEEFESQYFGIIPSDGDRFRLFSFRFHGSRKRVVLELEVHPLAFSYHTAERMLERRKNCADAFMAIAHELSTWYPAIRHAQGCTYFHTQGNINIPVSNEEGMLACTYEPAGYSKFEGTSRLIFDADGVREIPLPRPMPDTILVVETFVERFLFSDRLSYAMRSLDDWKSAHTPEAGWDANPFMLRGSGYLSLGFPDLSIESRRALSDILRDPSVVRAVHPDKTINVYHPTDKLLPRGNWANSLPYKERKLAA